eukprot:m.279803 g.279803  ORF g.279803 m.279803 type:complete len:3248 (+) comp40626_c0_seq3:859-10602(+)
MTGKSSSIEEGISAKRKANLAARQDYDAFMVGYNHNQTDIYRKCGREPLPNGKYTAYKPTPRKEYKSRMNGFANSYVKHTLTTPVYSPRDKAQPIDLKRVGDAPMYQTMMLTLQTLGPKPIFDSSGTTTQFAASQPELYSLVRRTGERFRWHKLVKRRESDKKTPAKTLIEEWRGELPDRIGVTRLLELLYFTCFESTLALVADDGKENPLRPRWLKKKKKDTGNVKTAGFYDTLNTLKRYPAYWGRVAESLTCCIVSNTKVIDWLELVTQVTNRWIKEIAQHAFRLSLPRGDWKLRLSKQSSHMTTQHMILTSKAGADKLRGKVRQQYLDDIRLFDRAAMRAATVTHDGTTNRKTRMERSQVRRKGKLKQTGGYQAEGGSMELFRRKGLIEIVEAKAHDLLIGTTVYVEVRTKDGVKLQNVTKFIHDGDMELRLRQLILGWDHIPDEFNGLEASFDFDRDTFVGVIKQTTKDYDPVVITKLQAEGGLDFLKDGASAMYSKMTESLGLAGGQLAQYLLSNLSTGMKVHATLLVARITSIVSLIVAMLLRKWDCVCVLVPTILVLNPDALQDTFKCVFAGAKNALLAMLAYVQSGFRWTSEIFTGKALYAIRPVILNSMINTVGLNFIHYDELSFLNSCETTSNSLLPTRQVVSSMEEYLDMDDRWWMIQLKNWSTEYGHDFTQNELSEIFAGLKSSIRKHRVSPKESLRLVFKGHSSPANMLSEHLMGHYYKVLIPEGDGPEDEKGILARMACWIGEMSGLAACTRAELQNLASFGHLVKTINGTLQLGRNVALLARDFVTLILEMVVGYNPFDKSLTSTLTLVQFYISFANEFVPTDKASLENYYRVVEEMNVMSRDVIDSLRKSHRGVCTMFEAAHKRLLALAPSVNAASNSNSIRCEPVAVMFSGEKGTGKSFAATYLQQTIVKLRKWLKPGQSISDYCFTKPAGAYWDPFLGKMAKITRFEEMFTFEDDEKLKEEVQLFLAVVNSARYLPEMAVATQKGQQAFESEFVIMTSNRENFTSRKLLMSDDGAFFRRMHLLVSVIPDDKGYANVKETQRFRIAGHFIDNPPDDRIKSVISRLTKMNPKSWYCVADEHRQTYEATWDDIIMLVFLMAENRKAEFDCLTKPRDEEWSSTFDEFARPGAGEGGSPQSAVSRVKLKDLPLSEFLKRASVYNYTLLEQAQAEGDDITVSDEVLEAICATSVFSTEIADLNPVMNPTDPETWSVFAKRVFKEESRRFAFFLVTGLYLVLSTAAIAYGSYLLLSKFWGSDDDDDYDAPPVKEGRSWGTVSHNEAVAQSHQDGKGSKSKGRKFKNGMDVKTYLSEGGPIISRFNLEKPAACRNGLPTIRIHLRHKTTNDKPVLTLNGIAVANNVVHVCDHILAEYVGPNLNGGENAGLAKFNGDYEVVKTMMYRTIKSIEGDCVRPVSLNPPMVYRVPGADFSLLIFDSRCPTLPSLLSKMALSSDIAIDDSMLIMTPVQRDSLLTHLFFHEKAELVEANDITQIVYSSQPSGKQAYKVRDYIQVPRSRGFGTCNSVYFNVAGVPCGHHVAGIPGGGGGIARPLYRELIEGALKKALTALVQPEGGFPTEIEATYACISPEYTTATANEIRPMGGETYGHPVDGMWKHVSRRVRHTKLRPSPFTEVLAPLFPEPGCKPVELDVSDPFAYGYTKGVNANVSISRSIHHDRIKAAMLEDQPIISWRSPEAIASKYDTALTIRQAIEGVDTPYGRIKPINFKTSPGPPWNVRMTPTSKWITMVDGKMVYIHPEMEADIVEILDMIHAGKSPQVVFQDSLKDEKLPCDKVDKGKIRIFYAVSVTFCIVQRMYFAPLLAAIAGKRTSIALGVNLNVGEYFVDQLFEDLQGEELERAKEQTISLDVSGFDKNVRSADAVALVDILSELLARDDDPQLMLLMNSIINVAHIGDKGQIILTEGQHPSGQALCFYWNSILSKYYLTDAVLHFLVTQKGVDVYDPKFRMQDYFRAIYGGDDTAAVFPLDMGEHSVADMLEWYAEHRKMTITTASKDGGCVDFQHYTKMEFCSRSIYSYIEKHGIKTRVFPLQFIKVMAIFFWEQKNASINDVQNTIFSGLIELSNYGPKIYTRVASALRQSPFVIDNDLIVWGYPTAKRICKGIFVPQSAYAFLQSNKQFLMVSPVANTTGGREMITWEQYQDEFVKTNTFSSRSKYGDDTNPPPIVIDHEDLDSIAEVLANSVELPQGEGPPWPDPIMDINKQPARVLEVQAQGDNGISWPEVFYEKYSFPTTGKKYKRNNVLRTSVHIETLDKHVEKEIYPSHVVLEIPTIYKGGIITLTIDGTEYTCDLTGTGQIATDLVSDCSKHQRATKFIGLCGGYRAEGPGDDRREAAEAKKDPDQDGTHPAPLNLSSIGDMVTEMGNSVVSGITDAVPGMLLAAMALNNPQDKSAPNLMVPTIAQTLHNDSLVYATNTTIGAKSEVPSVTGVCGEEGSTMISQIMKKRLYWAGNMDQLDVKTIYCNMFGSLLDNPTSTPSRDQFLLPAAYHSVYRGKVKINIKVCTSTVEKGTITYYYVPPGIISSDSAILADPDKELLPKFVFSLPGIQEMEIIVPWCYPENVRQIRFGTDDMTEPGRYPRLVGEFTTDHTTMRITDTPSGVMTRITKSPCEDLEMYGFTSQNLRAHTGTTTMPALVAQDGPPLDYENIKDMEFYELPETVPSDGYESDDEEEEVTTIVAQAESGPAFTPEDMDPTVTHGLTASFLMGGQAEVVKYPSGCVPDTTMKPYEAHSMAAREIKIDSFQLTQADQQNDTVYTLSMPGALLTHNSALDDYARRHSQWRVNWRAKFLFKSPAGGRGSVLINAKPKGVQATDIANIQNFYQLPGTVEHCFLDGESTVTLDVDYQAPVPTVAVGSNTHEIEMRIFVPPVSAYESTVRMDVVVYIVPTLVQLFMPQVGFTAEGGDLIEDNSENETGVIHFPDENTLFADDGISAEAALFCALSGYVAMVAVQVAEIAFDVAVEYFAEGEPPNTVPVIDDNQGAIEVLKTSSGSTTFSSLICGDDRISDMLAPTKYFAHIMDVDIASVPTGTQTGVGIIWRGVQPFHCVSNPTPITLFLDKTNVWNNTPQEHVATDIARHFAFMRGGYYVNIVPMNPEAASPSAEFIFETPSGSAFVKSLNGLVLTESRKNPMLSVHISQYDHNMYRITSDTGTWGNDSIPHSVNSGVGIAPTGPSAGDTQYSLYTSCDDATNFYYCTGRDGSWFDVPDIFPAPPG